MIAAHGLIHTRIDTIQLSKACAKLSTSTKTTSTADATMPAIRVTFHRAARTPRDGAWFPLIETPPTRAEQCINVHYRPMRLDVSTPCSVWKRS